MALRTPELWSDIHFICPEYDFSPRIHRYQRWLLRARTFPVTLSIHFYGSDSGFASALQSILLPIQVKRLSLHLNYGQFKILSTLPSILSRLLEFELDVTFPEGNVNANPDNPHPLIPRLQSATFRFEEATEALGWIDSLRPSLPWSQLRYLNLEITLEPEDLHLVFGILRQTPILEASTLSISSIAVLDPLTMPSLRYLDLQVDNHAEFDDQILRSFTCPPSPNSHSLHIAAGHTKHLGFSSDSTTFKNFENSNSRAILPFLSPPFCMMHPCYDHFCLDGML